MENLVALAIITGLFFVFYMLMPTALQWIALGAGVYITVSWVQYLRLNDPACFAMMFKSKAFVLASIGFPSISFVTYGLGFWSAPFMQRVHGESIADAGLYLGLGSAIGGFIGIVLGGFLADMWKAKNVNARLYIGLAIPILATPFGLGFLYTDSVLVAYLCSFVFSILSPAWIGSGASTINDLVMPRMRATASAYYVLMNTFLGLALGPYLIGQISDLNTVAGQASDEALRNAVTMGLAVFLFSMSFLFLALRYLRSDEESRLSRARALGEADV
jgi:MFS family permease